MRVQALARPRRCGPLHSARSNHDRDKGRGPSRRRTGGWVSRWSCPRTYPRLAGLAVGYVRSARENARNDLAQLEHRDEAWRALRRPTLDSQADHKLPRPVRAGERFMPQRTLVESSTNDDAGTHVPCREAACPSSAIRNTSSRGLAIRQPEQQKQRQQRSGADPARAPVVRAEQRESPPAVLGDSPTCDSRRRDTTRREATTELRPRR